MTTPFVTRGESGLRPPSGQYSRIAPEGITVHYGGPSPWTDASWPDRANDLTGAGHQHARCASIWRAWQAYHMTPGALGTTPPAHPIDIAYCVDAETEILTVAGWSTQDRLREGDLVLTLNHESGLSEWQPVIEVCRFPARPREMVLLRTDRHSSLTTPNHRWPVERTRRRGERRPIIGTDRLFVTTDTFGYWDRVPVAADCADLPMTPKYDDGLVEVVAWFWTEGNIHRYRDGSQGRNVGITQAAAAPDRCNRIRAALRRTFGPPAERMPRRGRTTDGVPRWREYLNGHKQEFWLSADAGDVLQTLAPGRIPTFEFLLTLTRAQLALFIETSMLADNSGERLLAQKTRAAAEAFQFACILAGYGTSLHPRSPTSSTPYVMWGARYRKQRYFGPRRIPALRVIHDGMVWCPRTPNQTWLARREGTVYFTGNTEGVCPGAVRFEGRPAWARTAANGSNEGNSRSLAVVYIAGVGDALTEAAKAAFLDEQDRLGVPLRWGHRDWFGTECPGDPLYGWRQAGFPSPAAPPSPPDPVNHPTPPRLVADVALTPHEGDDGPMARKTFDCGLLDNQGNGAVIFDGGATGDAGIAHFEPIRWADARDPNPVGSYPPADNGQHRPLPTVGWQERAGWVALEFYGGVPGSPVAVTLDVSA